MPKEVMGIECKFYLVENWDGEDEMPVTGIDEQKAVGDVTVKFEYDTEECSTRESIFKLFLKTMLEVGADLEIANRGYQDESLMKPIIDSFVPGGDPLCIAFLDGDATTGPYFGVIGFWIVPKLPREEKLNGKSVYKVTVMPTRGPDDEVPQFVLSEGA